MFIEKRPPQKTRTRPGRVAVAGRHPVRFVRYGLVAVSALLVLTGTYFGGSLIHGIADAAGFAWLMLSLTAVYVLVTGRPTWLQLKKARASALPVAASALGAFLIYSVAVAAIS